MYRIVSTGLAIVVLLLGLGTFASAQNCPNINGEWKFESTLIGYVTGNILNPGVQYPVTKSGTWMFYQNPGECFFYAYRYTNTANPSSFIGEESYITGVIYGNGSQITMAVKPDTESPPALYFGEIQLRRRVPTQITYVGHAIIGDLNTISPFPWPGLSGQAVYTSTGRIYR
jgi:hypothetical protein